jgi:hypothetical protein
MKMWMKGREVKDLGYNVSVLPCRKVGDMVPLGFHYLEWRGWRGWRVVMYKGYWCCRVWIFL